MQKLRGVKITKVIGIIFITVVMGFLVCIIGVNVIAQTNEKKYQDENYVIEKALKYLEKRYDEKFIITKYQGMGPMYGNVSMEACPEGKEEPRYTFQVQGYPNKWGSLDYYDTYVMVRLTGEYEEYVGNIIGEYFDEYKFYMSFSSEWVTSSLPVDTHLEDLWELKANEDYPLPSLFIYVVQKIERDKLKYFSDELQKIGYRGRVKVWYVEDAGRYDKLLRNDFGENCKYKDYDNVSTFFVYTHEIKFMEDINKWD